ncbi:hypothetical protein [Microbulbifer sp. HZ11]|uniref:hypothetical protein n=1 Tax=Microbulbifer sp. HZ11 TaxID=1453501 RepID=UPI0012DE1A99
MDESFSNFEGFGAGLNAQCQALVAAVRRWTSLPCCAGIAPTRTLAKAANHLAKTLGVSGGVLQIITDYHRQQLPVEEIWGVGPRLTNRLGAMGTMTACDLTTALEPTLRKAF